MSLPSNSAASAPPAVLIPDKNELQLLIHAIPEYRPGDNLSIFINEVDNLTKHLQGRLTPDLAYVVGFSIRSKIKGDARDFLAYQNATEWPEIRNALLRKYGDQRSEELLVSSLRQCVQSRNENYTDYYTRILQNFNALIQYISLHSQDPNLLAYKKFEYNQLSLKTFQIGILEPYRSYLSNFDLLSIEECLDKCRFYDNRKQEWDYCEFIRRTQDIHKKSSKTPSQTHTPTQFQNHTRSLNSNLQTQFRPTQQPSGNQPLQPRPFQGPINKPLNQQNKFFNNRQVFGPTSKPASTFTNLQKPTPMSIQSRVHTQQMPSRHFTQNKPQVISEELFNLDEIDLVEFSEEPNQFEFSEGQIQNEHLSEMNENLEDFHENASGEIN